MPRLTQITIPITGGSASFDANGVAFDLWFSRHPIRVSWNEIAFVSTTPFVTKRASVWVTHNGLALTTQEAPESLDFFVLAIVLSSRHALLSHSSFLTKIWLRSVLLLKPLYTADDMPDPSQGCVKLHLSNRWLRRSFPVLLNLLDLLDQHTRFDLLVTE